MNDDMGQGPDRNTAVVLLTKRPDPDQVGFLAGLGALGYDVFVVADVEGCTPPPAPVRLLFPSDLACAQAGFQDLNPTVTRHKWPARVSAWERGLYAMAVEHPAYAHVWFIEEDVFIPRLATLAGIDDRHGTADLLVRNCAVNTTGDRSGWGWYRRIPEDILPLPWGHSLVCAVRLGRRLLDLVRSLLAEHPKLTRYADRTQRWFFIEYLFHTLALHHGLHIVEAPELAGLIFRRTWTREEVSPGMLYHPVKDLAVQAAWRAELG